MAAETLTEIRIGKVAYFVASTGGDCLVQRVERLIIRDLQREVDRAEHENYRALLPPKPRG